MKVLSRAWLEKLDRLSIIQFGCLLVLREYDEMLVKSEGFLVIRDGGAERAPTVALATALFITDSKAAFFCRGHIVKSSSECFLPLLSLLGSQL